jgi:hypothetical protein
MVKFDTNHKNILRKCQEKFEQCHLQIKSAHLLMDLKFKSAHLICLKLAMARASIVTKPSHD